MTAAAQLVVGGREEVARKPLFTKHLWTFDCQLSTNHIMWTFTMITFLKVSFSRTIVFVKGQRNHGILVLEVHSYHISPQKATKVSTKWKNGNNFTRLCNSLDHMALLGLTGEHYISHRSTKFGKGSDPDRLDKMEVTVKGRDGVPTPCIKGLHEKEKEVVSLTRK
ncbi:hypothetical protein E2C01_046419 [Portunus trituberculatus]|uniref:Uncharacterized protein n=1 Tax=Portunus trituberculatus TaxID=210409 RepID=A0A5B7G5Y7_PORTR|nr:hypothetical protein [Portunus trituberculatus]